MLSSHCNAHAVNDSILTGWLIGGNFKEKNNHGACFTFHQSNYLKNTHKRDWSLPHFCLIPPYCHSFIRFLYVFLLSEISIPCFNHFKNLSVRWISPGMFICFKIGRFLFFYLHLSLVIFLIIEYCIAKPNVLCQWLYSIQRKKDFLSPV